MYQYHISFSRVILSWSGVLDGSEIFSLFPPLSKSNTFSGSVCLLRNGTSWWWSTECSTNFSIAWPTWWREAPRRSTTTTLGDVVLPTAASPGILPGCWVRSPRMCPFDPGGRRRTFPPDRYHQRTMMPPGWAAGEGGLGGARSGGRRGARRTSHSVPHCYRMTSTIMSVLCDRDVFACRGYIVFDAFWSFNLFDSTFAELIVSAKNEMNLIFENITLQSTSSLDKQWTNNVTSKFIIVLPDLRVQRKVTITSSKT